MGTDATVNGSTSSSAEPAKSPPGSLARVVAYFSSLGRRKFWGTVTFRFEAGSIKHVKVEQNFTYDQLPIDDPAALQVMERTVGKRQ